MCQLSPLTHICESSKMIVRYILESLASDIDMVMQEMDAVDFGTLAPITVGSKRRRTDQDFEEHVTFAMGSKKVLHSASQFLAVATDMSESSGRIFEGQYLRKQLVAMRTELKPKGVLCVTEDSSSAGRPSEDTCFFILPCA